MKDIVFHLLSQMLAHSPEASYKRLNPALRSLLGDCISADLPFQPDTFQRVYKELRGGWWFGAGAGSSVGEHYYSQACSCNHASAQQSFEAFAERPGVLWEENAKSPQRLHVGAQFTWKGYYVTVTSMRQDSLVACTYKDHPNEIKFPRVGNNVAGYNDNPHLITSVKRAGSTLILRVVKAPKTDGEREVARRFTIPYAEIVEWRRTTSARLKAMVAKIAECDPAKDGPKLTKEINAAHFRHWELETIQAAFQSRKDWVASEGKILEWRSGKGDAWLDAKVTVIRVNGDRVECSNGNSVSRASALRVLPILLDRRKASESLSLPLDSYTVNGVSAAGVKIGCTLVPWSEVELIKPALEAA